MSSQRKDQRAAKPSVWAVPAAALTDGPKVAGLAELVGIDLDGWQKEVLDAGLQRRPDEVWAARQVGLSMPRQNGKSELLVLRALAGALLFGEKTILVSAHQADTAREIFARMQDLIDANPLIEKRVEAVHHAVHREFVKFGNGAMIKLKARTHAGGRGFSADCLLLDEAQQLSPGAWQAMLPTLSARKNPQVWMLGTPPVSDDLGETFGRLRSQAAASVKGLAFMEWSADYEDRIEDPATWAKANPAYPARISHDAIADELAAMTALQFRMERLGMWPETARKHQVIEPDIWEGALGAPEDGAAPAAFGVDATHSGQFSVAACWMTGGMLHVEEVFAAPNAASVMRFLKARGDYRTPIVIDGLPTPVAPLIVECQQYRLNVQVTAAKDVAAACAIFVNKFVDGAASHGGQEPLTSALEQAVRRDVRDAGGWAWDRRDKTACIAPLVAATLSMFGAVRAGEGRAASTQRRGSVA